MPKMSLAVSFTFKLQTGHETAYKVERVFKRTDAVKVKTSICRFIEMKEEQIVLADKANEVNRKIEEPAGLDDRRFYKGSRPAARKIRRISFLERSGAKADASAPVQP